MPQTRFTDYKAAVNSFPQGLQNIGIIKPGRYNGFDTLTSIAGLGIQIEHSGAIRKTKVNGNAENEFGCLVMPTGIIVHDTDPVVLNVQTNAGNVNTRVDLVICEHEYTEIEGGTAATYSIIQGNNDGDIPVLTHPEKQVILGTIEIVPNGSTFNDLTYQPILVNLPGDLTAETLYTYIEELISEQIGQEGGEINYGANVGNGVAVYKGKVDEELQMKTLKSSDSSVQILQSGANEVDFKVNPASNIIDVSNNITLTSQHNGKILRCLTGSSDINITIPDGLPINFNCGFIEDKQTVPTSTGIYAYDPYTPRVRFLAVGSKVRSKNGNNQLVGPGHTAFLQGTSVQDYFILLGDTSLNIQQ